MPLERLPVRWMCNKENCHNSTKKKHTSRNGIEKIWGKCDVQILPYFGMKIHKFSQIFLEIVAWICTFKKRKSRMVLYVFRHRTIRKIRVGFIAMDSLAGQLKWKQFYSSSFPSNDSKTTKNIMALSMSEFRSEHCFWPFSRCRLCSWHFFFLGEKKTNCSPNVRCYDIYFLFRIRLSSRFTLIIAVALVVGFVFVHKTNDSHANYNSTLFLWIWAHFWRTNFYPSSNFSSGWVFISSHRLALVNRTVLFLGWSTERSYSTKKFLLRLK